MEKLVLYKGLNFVPTPNSLSIPKVVSSVEAALFNVDPCKGNEIRCAISNVLSTKPYRPRSNLTLLERRIIKDLKMDESIIITKADKGNAVVVMDKSVYITKTEELLDSSAYVAISEDPTDLTRRNLLHLTSTYGQQTADERIIGISKRLKFTSNANCPQLYCLPKVHKPGIPFRPIVSTINSETSGLSRYLASILKPLTGKNRSHTTDTRQFLCEVKNIALSPDDIFVSYDVKDLFTSVPLVHTYQLLFGLLSNDGSLRDRTKLTASQIVDLTKFCMIEGNHFRFRGKFFSQKQGAPMGSPLSPVLAELFMEDLERRAFFDQQFPIKIFKRYVDDVFCVIRRGSEQGLLDHLNSTFPNVITFTMEIEQNGRLPFLNALLMRKGARIYSKVYRKPTSTDLFIHYRSNHPPCVKRGLIFGMVDRAYQLCDSQFLADEIKLIRSVLGRNGYPIDLINRSIAQRLQRLKNTPEAPRHTDQRIVIPMPYYQGIGDAIRALSRDLGFTVRFSSSANLGALLRPSAAAVPPDQRPGAVYKITCGCGAIYIGETGNTISHRFKEHLSCLTRYRKALARHRGEKLKSRGRPQTLDPETVMEQAQKSSAIVEHATDCAAALTSLSASLILREPYYKKRKILESLFIRHNNTINKDEGFGVNEAWLPLTATIMQLRHNPS